MSQFSSNCVNLFSPNLPYIYIDRYSHTGKGVQAYPCSVIYVQYAIIFLTDLKVDIYIVLRASQLICSLNNTFPSHLQYWQMTNFRLESRQTHIGWQRTCACSFIQLGEPSFLLASQPIN
jgi:hypothetical protein